MIIALGSGPRLAPHIPRSHRKHTDPCGCSVPKPDVVVCLCGACYEVLEFLSFPVFRCYDCGREWVRR